MADVQPSVPLVAYLFATRLLPERHRTPHGTHIPCTHEWVPTQPLAVLLFASAFWSLRNRGLIAMEVDGNSSNGLIAHHQDVSVRRLASESRPGLEGAVMDHLEDEGTLCDVVCRWSGDGSTDPWHDTVHEEVAEALEWGYLREVPNNGGVIARFLWRESELEPNCGRIRSLEAEFGHFSTEWSRFRDREAPLHDRLNAECMRSLRACTEAWYP
jgi:hypothetical protein